MANPVTLPKDGNRQTAQLPPSITALSRTVNATISASTEITFDTGTTFIRVYAVDQDIYMKWGTDDVTSSNFDEVIPANKICDFFIPQQSNLTLYTAANFIERTPTATLILTELGIPAPTISTVPELTYKTNLLIWLMANDPTAGYANNDPIVLWPYTEGYGVDVGSGLFTLGNVYTNPVVFQENIINGLPAFYINNADQPATSAFDPGNNIPIDRPFTIFVVVKFDSTPAGQVTVFDGYNNNPPYDNALNWDPVNGWSMVDTHFGDGGSILSGDTSDPTQWVYFSTKWNGAFSKLYKNGVEIGSGTLSSIGQSSGYFLGAEATGTFNGMTGHVAEYLIYSEDISDGNRAIVESYLATKYGI